MIECVCVWIYSQLIGTIFTAASVLQNVRMFLLLFCLVSPGLVEWQLWWDGPARFQAGSAHDSFVLPHCCWASQQEGTDVDADGWGKEAGEGGRVTRGGIIHTSLRTPHLQDHVHLFQCVLVYNQLTSAVQRRAPPCQEVLLCGSEVRSVRPVWDWVRMCNSNINTKVCIPEDCLHEIWHTVVLHYYGGGWGVGVELITVVTVSRVGLDPHFIL